MPTMSHTIRNLREVEDVAPKFGFDAMQEARFPRQELGARDTGLALHSIKPGVRGVPHRHQHAEEVYVVLRGHGHVKLDDELIEIGPYDAIRVAPTVARAFAAGDEGLEILVFGPHHERDGEMLESEGFWS
jgi:mannose-6-phosphate isomerase-like protein (cupin superfamily)